MSIQNRSKLSKTVNSDTEVIKPKSKTKRAWNKETRSQKAPESIIKKNK